MLNLMISKALFALMAVMILMTVGPMTAVVVTTFPQLVHSPLVALAS